jgi:hypothetical protein
VCKVKWGLLTTPGKGHKEGTQGRHTELPIGHREDLTSWCRGTHVHSETYTSQEEGLPTASREEVIGSP